MRGFHFTPSFQNEAKRIDRLIFSLRHPCAAHCAVVISGWTMHPSFYSYFWKTPFEDVSRRRVKPMKWIFQDRDQGWSHICRTGRDALTAIWKLFSKAFATKYENELRPRDLSCKHATRDCKWLATHPVVLVWYAVYRIKIQALMSLCLPSRKCTSFPLFFPSLCLPIHFHPLSPAPLCLIIICLTWKSLPFIFAFFHLQHKQLSLCFFIVVYLS